MSEPQINGDTTNRTTIPLNLLAHNSSSQDNLSSANNTTFASHEAKVETNVLAQVTQTSDNLPSNVCELLENRKVENTTEKAQNIQTVNRMTILIDVFTITTLAYIALSVITSQLFIIGIATSVLFLTISTIRSVKAKMDINDIGIQNISIDMFLSAIKNNMPTTDISPEQNTKLLDLLNNAVNSAPFIDRLKLSDQLCDYNIHKKTNQTMSSSYASEPALKESFKTFTNHLFDNTDLTNYLHELNFNVTNLKQSAHNYIDNTTIDDISKTFAG